ncbi:MAG: hypothetical protein ABWZ65_22230, partial [Pseudomonas mandelii]
SQNASGGAHDRTLLTYPGNAVHQDWLNRGYHDVSIPLDYREGLVDGKTLEVEFKAALDKGTDENTAQKFPVRTYALKAVADVKPEITTVTDSKGVEIAGGGTTVDTSITLSGTASKGQQVDVLDGSVSKGQPTADPSTGIWTLPVTGLSVAAHSFTAKALYGSGQTSAARTLTVTALIPPTISSVKGSPSGVEIPQGGTTLETAVTLTGTASNGQQVDVLDGIVSKGQPTAGPSTGIWTLPVSGLSVAAHSFAAKALYGSGQVSEARTLTVTAHPALVVDTTPLVLSGENISIVGTSLPWVPTGDYPADSYERRFASGGVPPITFESSNVQIASVDRNSGMIRSEGNGIATITVSDSVGQTREILVTCFNVAKYIYNPTLLTWNAYESWRISQGASWPINNDSLVHDRLLNMKYTLAVTQNYWGGPREVNHPYRGGVAAYWLETRRWEGFFRAEIGRTFPGLAYI